MAQKG